MEVGKRVAVHQIPGALVFYDDGSVERFPPPVPLLPASLQFIDGVATKDACINACKGTWARIFLPDSVAQRTPSAGMAPMVLHFHGGGMCLGSPAESVYHNFCSRMASSSGSIWISVAYRLAPEHRLPAQYQDCFESICWLRSHFTTTKRLSERTDISAMSTCGGKIPWEIKSEASTSADREPWLVQHGDVGRVFCTGESAGATILHFVTLQMVRYEWSPLHVRGLIFVDLGILADPLPQMMPSTDLAVTTEMMATSVEFCLPMGVKLGDPILDCLHPDSKPHFELPWPPVLILVAERDLLREGGMAYFQCLKHAGKVVELLESHGKGHCFHLTHVDSEAHHRERRMLEFMRKLSL